MVVGMSRTIKGATGDWDIVIGMEVEVAFEHNDDVYLPVFRPTTDGGDR